MPLRLIRLIAFGFAPAPWGLRHLKQPAQCQMAGPVTLIPLCRGVWRDRMLSLGWADAIPQIPPALIEPRARPRLPGALCLLSGAKAGASGFWRRRRRLCRTVPVPEAATFPARFFRGDAVLYLDIGFKIRQFTV